jgi:hypothetical protein
MKILLIAVAVLLATNAVSEPLAECQARNGLPNVFAKLEAGEEVRVAYLGGSITDAEGWRVPAWARCVAVQTRFAVDAWGAGVVRRYLPSLWKAVKPGESIAFKFHGTALGLAGLRGPDSGQFRVTVDDAAPVTGTFFDRYASEGRWMLQPWIYPGDLPAGEHRVRIELIAEPPDKVGILKKHNRTMKDPEAFKVIFSICGAPKT